MPTIAKFGRFQQKLLMLHYDRENPLIAVEVKSDRDTFERLHRQLVEHERLATGIYVALDARHYGGWIRKFESRFPRVGVLVYDGGKIEETHRAVVRDPASIEWLDVLWGAELKAMFSPFRGRSKVPGNLRAMLEMIRAVFTPLEIEEMARAIFLRRLATGKPGGGALADIPGIETRKPLFDRALAAHASRRRFVTTELMGEYVYGGALRFGGEAAVNPALENLHAAD